MNDHDIKQKFDLLKDTFNERAERLFAAAEAKVIGKKGISIVSRATGLERHRIARGIKELENKEKLDPKRIRNSGAGRKKIVDTNPKIKENLESLIEPYSRGDPESSLRWTTKSLRKLSSELKEMNYNVSHEYVAYLLRSMKYSLQGNRKTREGADNPDRNAQFEHIYRKLKSQQNLHDPVISVDAKKKEIVGNFKNSGREWRPRGTPEEVQMHDFMVKKLGKVCPYGVYDLSRNEGWISVGIDHDTAAFAVESIRQWWNTMGKREYPNAKSLLITADAGGSNGYRNKLWKKELQKLANKVMIPISICHFPPGTSKWNKIEHRLFSFISKNWRAKPLVSHEVIVNLISSTTTQTGLKVRCRIDERKYPTEIKISDKEIENINMKRDIFHPEWNYAIYPNKQVME
jgi:hypothetical protein